MDCTKVSRCRCGQHRGGLRDVGKSDYQPTARDVELARASAAVSRERAAKYPNDPERGAALLGMACVADATADRMEERRDGR